MSVSCCFPSSWCNFIHILTEGTPTACVRAGQFAKVLLFAYDRSCSENWGQEAKDGYREVFLCK